MRIAVTGAAGSLGRRVVQLLADRADVDVVAMTRRKLPAEALPPGVECAVADYADPPALRAALKGVDTLVLVSSDGPDARVLLHHRNVVAAVVAERVGHVAALSSVDADSASPFCYAVVNRLTEDLLLASGVPCSFARASLYIEFFLGWLTQARSTGLLRLPAADGRVSLVARDDVARALAALAVGGPTGRHHDITGPESTDLAGIASTAAEVWRTPVAYVDIPADTYSAETAATGLDPWWLYAFSSLFASVREQRWDRVRDDCAQLTGRLPRTLRDVLSERA
ncbi:putative epimerase [Streptomyces ambofaciens ATCC 23877]|uniref:Putative epimerase n=2 Tax=Streptomyces ambofaciens TaxID=1889 RepID=A0A0K2AZU1_STRA7|nr:NAD(P)H-binding protein [Streptomyces ambofaciens]AKZ58640.1 putative epimerase [Streptomyces ambofaciens ATCC 23877]CAM96609.1 putative epimerase [Streptomyces ambofaciens ATCC 23877]